MMRRLRLWSVLAITAVMAGMIGGCASSTPAAHGTMGGRQLEDSHADDSNFDPSGFMSGFEGTSTP
jgi:hypothetical protein